MTNKESMDKLHENITKLSGIITGFDLTTSLTNITTDLLEICQSKKEMNKAITSIGAMITDNDAKIKLFNDTLQSMEDELVKLDPSTPTTSTTTFGGSSRRKKRGLKSKKRRSVRRKIKGGGRRSRRNRTRKNIR